MFRYPRTDFTRPDRRSDREHLFARSRWRSWGSHPFAGLLEPMGGVRVSAFRAHMPLTERPPRPFLDRGIAVSYDARDRADCCASHSGSTVDRGRPGRLLGFGPIGRPYRRRLCLAACPALGFGPLSGIRTGVIAGVDARCPKPSRRPSVSGIPSGDSYPLSMSVGQRRKGTAQTADAGRFARCRLFARLDGTDA
jgi:hypothetical protein